ncbi:hypothetical protein GVN21_08115 [Caulobacter sp. SLTY]|uniref:beta strand repeat-containing protein n=1 Tax=Caulobacter sp. SLTY TaxID=2683262 RepID=UPI001412457D|nr:integrin alpha [Caulobacter sp. SLTY]NBB15319.1 hypothetical protein [Caulobacter sp. SLTY]
MPFDAVLQLSTLNGTTGFQIRGVLANDVAGKSIASAGDINGDGIDDLIIGAWGADPNGGYSGASYVVFGTGSGFGTSFELSSLDGTNGFRLSGAAAGDRSGFSVSSAGDINGDGIDDLIIGAYFGAGYAGNSYVVFGRDTASTGDFAANLSLSDLDGSNGFRIVGAAGFDLSGRSVASAGDVNGDGIGDLIIGAPFADPNGSLSGASYVVFGRDTATEGDFSTSFNLASLDGTNGFRISGVASADRSGFSVAAAGDVNGDGIGDVIVGAYGADPNGSNSGAAYVVFGRDTGTVGDFAANINLSALDGSNGFRLSGATANDQTGYSVASAGDVNGDGIDDLIIGARGADPNGFSSGATYVVFGRDTAIAGDFTASLNLSALDGSNGFRISGVGGYDESGWSVASAGDVNGDGFDDLLIGAPYSDPNGASNAGASFVVFGGGAGFASNLNLSALDGSNGFRINGVSANDNTGAAVAAAGDVNGDGIDDLIVGAPLRDPNGSNSGASYVIFGRLLNLGTPANDTTTGGASGDQLAGQSGADVLSGLDGDDVLDGGATLASQLIP